MIAHAFVKSFLAVVSKGWVAEIMRKAREFNDIRLYLEYLALELRGSSVEPNRYRLGDLRNF